MISVFVMLAVRTIYICIKKKQQVIQEVHLRNLERKISACVFYLMFFFFCETISELDTQRCV